MQFGKKASEAPKFEGAASGTRYMRTLKEGEHRMRFLQETKDWVFYWEHFNPTPGGFPFPCTQDRTTCPGCTSGIERMEKASPKYAVNAKMGDFVEIVKFPTKFFNKMEIRSERNKGTITDRDYLVTRIGKDTSTDYDIDMLMPTEMPSGLKLHNIEESLAEAFKEAWPDFDPETGTGDKTSGAFTEGAAGTEPDFAKDEAGAAKESGLDEFSKPQDSAQSGAEKEVTEADLRAMTPLQLVQLCKDENVDLPADIELDTKTIVDWMLENL